MPIGFIGLGNLGTAIAKRLSEMGEEVHLWNRTRAKAESLGFPIAESPKALIETCDTILLCMFDSPAVENVLMMENGLFDADIKGKTIIDLTTNHFEPVIGFHTMTEAKGGKYLESPVFGSVIPASKGEVTIVTSGKKELFDACLPLLEKMGKNIFHLEGMGQATKMKLINNLCLGSFMATLAECTALGESCGIDKSRLLEILGVGGGQSLVLKAKTQKLIDEDFSPHFSNAAINKDLHCLQDLAYSMDRPLYTGSVVKELFSKMRMMGKGDEDLSSIYQLFKNS